MAKESHVPKFGNWDGDNVPYTAYFENARKEKVGGVRMNPNDPEENPDAFLFSGIMNGISDTSINSSVPSRKSKNDKATSSARHYNNQRNPYDQQTSVSQKNTSSTTSESRSEKSNPDKVCHNRNLHQRKRSENKKSISENSPNFYPLSPSPGRNRQIRGGANGSESDDLSHRSTTSVPKFGAWNESDPRSAEGFTVIFNKVKEEKQMAAAKYPAIQSESIINTRPETESQKRKSSSSSKMRCCLF